MLGLLSEAEASVDTVQEVLRRVIPTDPVQRAQGRLQVHGGKLGRQLSGRDPALHRLTSLLQRRTQRAASVGRR